MSRVAPGRALLVAVGLAMAAPVAAAELPPLRQNEHINDRLLVAAIGDQIRRNCPRISARRWVVRMEALKLLNHALRLGYDRATIEAYLEDEDARGWMAGRRDAWLAANGAVAGDAESFCRIGLREIGNGTYLGSLMRAD